MTIRLTHVAETSIWRNHWPWLRLWGPLILILALALGLRSGYMSGLGFEGDLSADIDWIKTIQSGGLLNLYANQTQTLIYPPISMIIFGTVGLLQTTFFPGPATLQSPTFIVLLKLFPVLCELALIAAVYIWLRRKPLLCWLIPGLLAIHPALVATSAWWGQNDAEYTLFLVLALLALNRDHPVLSWLMFGLAVLTKQQAVALLPVLAVLCFRRYSLRTNLLAVGGFVLLIVAFMLPFIIASGPEKALLPYLNSASVFPGATINALNFWYVAAPLSRGIVLQNWPSIAIYNDANPVLGPFSFRTIGLCLLALYTLLLCVSMWKRAHEKREFVWAAALYYGVFMFLTQMHERYLYPGSVLAVIGIAQEPQLWLVALGAMYTSAYNVLQIATQYRWLGLNLWFRTLATWIALLNMTLLAEITWQAIHRLLTTEQASKYKNKLSPIIRPLLLVSRAFAIALVVAIALALIAANGFSLYTGHWIAEHIADGSNIVVEREANLTFDVAKASTVNSQWNPKQILNVEKKSVSNWYSNGANYLLLDEQTEVDGVSFSKRLQSLADQGASVIYETKPPSILIPRFAILWTFHPQHRLNDTFSNSLFLAGYDVNTDVNGDMSLLLYWYTYQPTDIDYNIFVHLSNSTSQELLGQADVPLGQGTHPTSTWRNGEIVFDEIILPKNLPVPGTIIRLGLYQLSNGFRAQVVDSNQKSMGDSIELADWQRNQ